MKRILLFTLPLLILAACNPKSLVETEQLTAQQTIYLTDAHTDSLFLSFEIEYPTRMPSEEALALVQTGIVTSLFGERYANMPLPEAMKAYIDMCRQEYIDNNRALAEQTLESDEDEEFGMLLCEEQVMTGRVVFADKRILSYEIEQYVYMGGAHGMNSRHCYNFCMESGLLLNEDDLFAEGYQEPLSELLRTALVEQSEEFDSADALTAAGFDLENVRPNGNFSFSEDGITWVFTPYEIAPYVYGETEIFLDNSRLEKLKKKE